MYAQYSNNFKKKEFLKPPEEKNTWKTLQDTGIGNDF
jgi:hypothetical protein